MLSLSFTQILARRLQPDGFVRMAIIPPEHFYTDRATVQFLYPFKVDRWETFRQGITGFLNEKEYDLHSALLAAQHRLESAFGENAPPVRKANEILNQYVSSTRHHSNRRKSDQSLMAEIRALVRELPATSQELREVGQDLLCLELSEVIRENEAKIPENMMRFVAKKINDSQLPLLKQAKYWPGHCKGTRGYLERKQPYVEAKLKAESLAIENPKMLPDVSAKLPSYAPFRSRPGIRMTSTIRLLSTGFGCVRLKVHLANEQGLQDLVDEVVFTTKALQSAATPSILKRKTALARNLRRIILEAVQKRTMLGIESMLQRYTTSLDTEDICNRLRTAVDQITLVNGELTADDIVDIENLDRGFSREHVPHLLWKGSKDGASSMYEYFQHITQSVFLEELSEALLRDEDIIRFVNRPERRRRSEQSESIFREQLMSTIPNLAFPSFSLSIEEHPYVSTYLSAPSFFKRRESIQPNQVVEHFSTMFETYKKDLVRILMKSKWAALRSNWQPTDKSLENVFYSDLVHMVVHIRSTLCLYYTPGSADELQLIPELAHVYKYLEELSDTVQWQRILWYAYSTSDQLVTQDIRSISAALEVLKEKSLEEEFSEVIEGLADVIRGIDHRKIALAETIEDPLSRKSGSSLFFDLIEKTNRIFNLDILYRNLLSKVERLDMLGMHVSQNVEEYSSLLVQEGSRSAQLTLEFLEALIIGFYAAELVHLGLPEHKPFPLSEWWSFYAISLGGFLTALPFISLIRKGRAKISVKDPKWLEWLERIGVVVGPAILLTIIYLTIVSPTQTQILQITGLIGIFLIVVGGWYQSSEKLIDRFFSWIKEKS